MSSRDYIKAAIDIAEQRAKDRGLKLSSKANTPMAGEYYPKMDGTT